MIHKKVLVTGATGFLGNNIVRKLSKLSIKAVVLVRKNTKINQLEQFGCDIFRMQGIDDPIIEKAASTCHYVIHCAAKTDQNDPDFSSYYETNFQFTQKIIDVCKKQEIKRLIFISSANCFTPGCKEYPGSEESGFMDYLKHSGYAYSKYLAQQLVFKAARENKLPAVILAPTFMLGAYDYKPSSGLLIRYIINNRILFYPKGGKSFVDINAVVTAVLNAFNQGKTGECYLLSGVNMTYKAFFKKVAAQSHQKKILIPIPHKLVSLIALAYRLVPTKKLLLLKTNLTSLFLDNYFQNTKARRDLGLPDTNIDHVIVETIHWLKSLNQEG